METFIFCQIFSLYFPIFPICSPYVPHMFPIFSIGKASSYRGSPASPRRLGGARFCDSRWQEMCHITRQTFWVYLQSCNEVGTIGTIAIYECVLLPYHQSMIFPIEAIAQKDGTVGSQLLRKDHLEHPPAAPTGLCEAGLTVRERRAPSSSWWVLRPWAPWNGRKPQETWVISWYTQ